MSSELRIVLAIGLPGSGKSTYFAKLGAHPISSDTIRLQLADDETEAAMSKLGAFINQVEAFRDAGVLSEGQGASLLEIARDVMARATERLALGGVG